MELRELDQNDFPGQLLELPKPPERLWLRGTLPPPDTRILAVVGSRALTRYGREACEYLLQGLAGYPVSVVSGLALGADAWAHRVALNAGLHTIAVPGTGLSDNVLGPRSNFGLAMDILDAGGALLSEQEPEHLARNYDFPARNRIMVGLAHAVLVVEAGAKSGTLITARLATDYNRELLCVPHRIGDPHSAGNMFLRMGAAPVTDPIHILEALGITPRPPTETQPANLNEKERMLYDLLAEPRSRDELIRCSGLPAHEALAIAGTLELKGVLKEEFGLWRRCAA